MANFSITDLTLWITFLVVVIQLLYIVLQLWGFRRARKKANAELAEIRAEWSQLSKRQNTIQVALGIAALFLLIIINASRAYRAYKRHWRDE